MAFVFMEPQMGVFELAMHTAMHPLGTHILAAIGAEMLIPDAIQNEPKHVLFQLHRLAAEHYLLASDLLHKEGDQKKRLECIRRGISHITHDCLRPIRILEEIVQTLRKDQEYLEANKLTREVARHLRVSEWSVICFHTYFKWFMANLDWTPNTCDDPDLANDVREVIRCIEPNIRRGKNTAFELDTWIEIWKNKFPQLRNLEFEIPYR